MTVIAFTKVKKPFGWMGNMSPHPVEHEGKVYRTAEALFQALRFNEGEIREAIRAEKSPMSAKMVAKKHRKEMRVFPESTADLEIMGNVVTLKLKQHPELQKELLDTGDELIVEDCTKRDRGSARFWGAVLVDGEWQGENKLGKIWMGLRAKLEAGVLK
jgi:ribA/ribD-fused uncharacterized protein